MKKLVIGFVILVVFLTAVFLLLKGLEPEQPLDQPPAPMEARDEQAPVDFPEPAPGAVVFDMKYRGLSGAKDELRYNSYWGFGHSGEETPLIAELKKDSGQFTTVYNPNFKGAEWSAVEVKDSKAVAFYFDLNADGKVSENEKILPTQGAQSGSSNRAEFVTPDFMMTTPDGRQVQFRVLLQVAFYGQSSRPNCMWSPSCVLEGTSTLNSKPTTLILFAGGFSGAFDEFGRSSYALQTGAEQSGPYVPRSTLSSIINYEGQFYYLKLQGNYGKGESVRAVLEEYTGAKGDLAVALSSQSALKTKLNGAGITGSPDSSINFYLQHNQAALPLGTYKIGSGFIQYGTESDDQWRLDFKEGPEVAITADKTCNVELGKPELSISAVDETKRYSKDVKEQTIYAKGTNVYISRIVKGKAGELYGRFSEKQKDSPRYTDIQPDLRIVDSEGREVAAAKIEYG